MYHPTEQDKTSNDRINSDWLFRCDQLPAGYAGQYSTVAVPRVDFAIGAELLTSRKLVFGTLIGDR